MRSIALHCPGGRKVRNYCELRSAWTYQTGWIDDALEKSVVPLISMGKLLPQEDIAESILFLASEQAGMLTGQVINVSGGHAL